MNNSSLPIDGGVQTVPVAAAASVDGRNSGGGVLQHFSSLCRNLTNINGTKPGTAATAVEDTDFGAVLYIVVVLTFYSLGIVIMIVKYLKTEKKEMEEEMVLDSFFKGIPDKRIENEKEAVNRVAIQAFHTLTTSKRPRGLPQSSQDSNHDRRPTAAHQHKKLLSPASYRRERYSIQPMYIGTSRQIEDDDLSDYDENDDENEISDKSENGDIDETNRSKRTRWTSENVDSRSARIESKPQKSVLFSDTINEDIRYNCEENGDIRYNKNGVNSNFPQPSTSESAGSSNKNGIIHIRIPSNSPAAGGNSPHAETNFANSSKQTATAAGTYSANTQNTSLENVPLNVLSNPKGISSKNAGKGFLSTRKTSKGMMMKYSQDSPDLGLERNLVRMSSLEKGAGDGSSYDSSSSLLTRIHLAEPFTPPLRTKNLQNTRMELSSTKPSSSENCLSNSVDENGSDCSSSVKRPSTFNTETDGQAKSNDEKLKLTAGKNVSSMQPSYDSIASSKGLTTRVDILDSSGGRDGGSRSCLVTDL